MNSKCLTDFRLPAESFFLPVKNSTMNWEMILGTSPVIPNPYGNGKIYHCRMGKTARPF